MHIIIQFFGIIVVIVGGAVLYFGLGAAGEAPGSGLVTVAVMATGLGTVVSGAAIYCFGAIVQHLIAIRRNSEAQLEIFQQRIGQR